VRLTARAPAKVNLSLFLGGVRGDGRHELVTLLESISLADELNLETLDDGKDEVSCPGVQGPNLVDAALRGLREAGWNGPPVRIEIRKRIPVAGGMGGGSADTAAALRLAARVAPVREETLAELAESLGADVPGQLAPGVALASGAGEVIAPAERLAPHAFLVVPQSFALSTADVYHEAGRLGLPRAPDELARCLRDLREALTPGGQLPERLLVNDLEPAALSLRPDIKTALDAVRDAGADYVMVCGSGPTVLGVYWEEDCGQRAAGATAVLSRVFPGVSAAAPAPSSHSGKIGWR